ncbi:hypothetical protein C8J56DRAFT_1043774 [Mycena floridula]|nr:hypothetical protein C8J56DRAFT_1043774 [Mycena floridula]
MNRRVCDFFNKPGGCNKGENCRFSHQPGSGQQRRSQQTGSNSQRPSPANISDVPRGSCIAYWTKGHCFKGFNCKYRHEQPGQTSSPASSPSSSTRPSISSTPIGGSSISPFLTQEGLAKLAGSGTDAFFPSNSRSPTETHSALKRFLQDDFRFRTTLDIYTFSSLIAGSATTNTSWTSEDGQLLLVSIATGNNGFLRIQDVFKWEPVSHKAGSDRSTLSFQRALVPLLQFFSSEVVVKSTLSQHVNGLYMILFDHLDIFLPNFVTCMENMICAKSFKDPQRISEEPLGTQIFVSMITVFFEVITRIKDAPARCLQLIPTIKKLEEWMQTWMAEVILPAPAFDDPFKSIPSANRDHVLDHLRAKMSRLMVIVDREDQKLLRAEKKSQPKRFPSNHQGLSAALRIVYEGPGDIRPEGKRHDNDFADIAEIRIAPTHEELICTVPPYLPANFHDAPHHFPSESMERLLDIQFRLLREELTASLRTSVQLVWDDLLGPKSGNRSALAPILKNRGGRYRGAQGRDSVLFNIYTGVEFTSLSPDRRGLSVGLTLDTPPGRARAPSAKARASFWESTSGKRLMQGGLVALLWKEGREIGVHLGVISSSSTDLVQSARHSTDHISIRVSFFDSRVQLKILNTLKRQDGLGERFLIESPVMFESIRPFLEALRMEPASIPFGSRYLVHRPENYLQTAQISPPAYAVVPGFRFQLASLFPPESGITDLKLNVSDPDSVRSARETLKESRLDPSQADAVLDTLTRELTLIQGPPGTGKSFTGVEILRVLLANKIRPILMIAFTNHALDHLLSSVLDAKITDKLVRLGSRSADERISQFSMEALEKAYGKSRLERSFAREYRALKLIEEEIIALMKDFLRTYTSSDDILKHLRNDYPEHYEHVMNPPDWILALRTSFGDDDPSWQIAGGKGKGKQENDDSLYGYWRTGRDLQFLVPPEPTNPVEHDKTRSNRYDAFSTEPADLIPQTEEDAALDDADDLDDDIILEEWQRAGVWQKSKAESAATVQPIESLPQTVEAAPVLELSDIQNPAQFFAYFGQDQIPTIPSSDRPLDELKDYGAMWNLSLSERARLHSFFETEARETLHLNRMGEFERLRERHAQALRLNNQSRDETRRQLLQSVDIVGCTTNGAAKLTSLLKGVSPRVMLVEEAGQVLEAHILGSLVPSVEHLILIGDPLQLRPTLNNYSLSMDNRDGGQLYKFDMSLMERLSQGGLAMSQINVQRRMRPVISDLIRKTLYPGLQDHPLVTEYPDVRGFTKNMFFISHDHREGGFGNLE